MIVDCDSCGVRGRACGDCVMGVLLGVPELPDADGSRRGVPSGASPLQLDAAERRALEVLADQGLIPRLRVVPARPVPDARSGGTAPSAPRVRDVG